MIRSLIQWLDAKSFEKQLLILAGIFDPLGFLAGYLLAPSVGLDPLMGGVYGLVAASYPLSMWVVRHTRK